MRQRKFMRYIKKNDMTIGKLRVTSTATLTAAAIATNTVATGIITSGLVTVLDAPTARIGLGNFTTSIRIPKNCDVTGASTNLTGAIFVSGAFNHCIRQSYSENCN